MSATYALFTRWKTAKGHKTDGIALAALGLSHGAAVHWKAGREAEADIIERMAREIGDEPAVWAAKAMAGRTKGDVSRAWERIGDGLSKRLMPIMSTVRRVLTGRVPADRQAGPPH